jgi:magnesium transporter
MQKSSIKKIQFRHFTWINITNPGSKEIEYLRKNYNFHPLDLQDCVSPTQRTKIDIYPNYTFLVVLFPVYNRKTREIIPGELDFFISRKYLISINHGDFAVFTDFFHLFELQPDSRHKYPGTSPERLLYEILNKLFLYCFPMLDHLIVDCDNIEKAIFSNQLKQMISEILLLRRNITDFRKIMQVHKNVLKKMITNFKENPLYDIKKTDVYFESLIDYTKEIWDTLENLKERIEALQETNESQISFKLSHIMKTLTIISVITFPITLIAGIFGMNTLHGMPWIDHPLGFWMVIGFMGLIVATMLTTFKKKGWF